MVFPHFVRASLTHIASERITRHSQKPTVAIGVFVVFAGCSGEDGWTVHISKISQQK
jgi:hypothetical protein